MHHFFIRLMSPTQSGGRAAKVLVRALLGLCLLPALALAADTPEVAPLSLPGAQSFVYKAQADWELRLHVVSPAGGKPSDRRTAVLAFFGGGWSSGTPERSIGWARWAASQGMVGIAADYRSRQRFQTTPEASIADGRSALAWVAAHAAELGLDPQKIIVMGSSAGAHVAAWTALSHNAPWPDEQPRQVLPAAVMLVSPVTDTKAGGYGGPVRFGDSPARALAASVTDHLNPGLAPTLVFHAVQDKTVPYANSEAFCAAMRTQQNRCDLVTFTEGGHTFYAQSQGGALALEKIYRDMQAFIESLGLWPLP